MPNSIDYDDSFRGDRHYNQDPEDSREPTGYEMVRKVIIDKLEDKLGEILEHEVIEELAELLIEELNPYIEYQGKGD